VSRSFYVVGEITSQIALPFFRDAKRITDVVISSPGGDFGLTLGMFDVAHSRKMNTYVVGFAQSAAAVLLQGGKWRTMTNSSLLMFHGPEEGATQAELRLVEQLVDGCQARRDGRPGRAQFVRQHLHQSRSGFGVGFD
jgi:ATP-dependent protease ClpP protease subunit